MPRFFHHILLVIAIVLLVFGGVAVTQHAIAAPASAPHAQSTAGNPTVCTWLNCKTGAISYSQDDTALINPNRAVSCHDDLLNAGLKGTFYYDGNNASHTWLSTLSNEGHEVGSHLVSHNTNCTTAPSCFPDCTPESLWQTPYTITDVNNFRQNQIDPNVALIESLTGKPVVSMAYPCGSTDAARMTGAQYYFPGARGYYDPYDSNFPWIYDVNAPTPVEFMNLNSDTYFNQTLVDKAVNEGSWEIVTVHDYCPGINVLKGISNTVWIAPVGDVLKYIRVRNATQITNYVRAGYNISFDAVHTLGTFQRQRLNGTPLLPIVYDNPVTIRTPITTTANVVSVQLNGAGITYTVGMISGTKYVWFNTPLTTTQHVNILLDAPTAVRVSSLQAAGATPNLLPVLFAAGSAGIWGIVAWKQRRRR